MTQVRGLRHVDFDGAKLSFFPDLSRRTLMQHRALKPLLAALQDGQLPYRWGFPFSLSATKDGKQSTLRSKADLPHFLESLGLPQVDIPDRRYPSQTALNSGKRIAADAVGDPGEAPLPKHPTLHPLKEKPKKQNFPIWVS